MPVACVIVHCACSFVVRTRKMTCVCAYNTAILQCVRLSASSLGRQSSYKRHAPTSICMPGIFGMRMFCLRAIIDSLGSTAQHLLHSAIANFVSVSTCLWCGVQCVLLYVVFMDYDIRSNALCSFESCVCDV